MAKYIGAFFGYFYGGLMGAMLGYFVGSFFGQGLRSNLRDGYNLHSQSGDIFFYTTFSLMGHMAKADGHVSEGEIAQAEVLMAKLGVKGQKRDEAIQYFQQGASADFDMQAALNRFLGAARFRADLKRNLLMFLVEIAIADDELHSSEEDMLRRVAAAIHIDMQSFERMVEMLKAQRSFTGGSSVSSADELERAYKAIGVPEAATDKEVKHAYRKLMSQYHPDKMIAKGVSEDMLAMTTEKAQEIQVAYDIIEKSRK